MGDDVKDADDFFVGYLPVPAGVKRFNRLVAVVLLMVAGVAGIVIAGGQQDPGPAVWEDGTVVELKGLVMASPYAMIRVQPTQSGEAMRTLLLENSGKLGAVDRVKTLDGTVDSVKGTLLKRDSIWMMELDDGWMAEGQKDSAVKGSPPEDVLLGNVALHGELIDPKCYVGAMKPGGGKTHRACAQLCISGGIPPMLVTRDAAMHETYYLLETKDGGAANEMAVPFAGDRVEVSGALYRSGDLLILRVRDGGIVVN